MRFIRLGLNATVAILAFAALAVPTFGATRRERADRHGRTRLHDHDEQEDREGGDIRDHHPRPLEHPRLPSDRARRQQEDERPRGGTTKWTVKLKKGTYHFVCDPHHTIMHGILKVT